MEKTLEITILFKSGASITFLAADFNIQEGETGSNVYVWTDTPRDDCLSLMDFDQNSIDAVLKKEISIERRLT